MSDIRYIYNILIKNYSPQGWWPLLEVKGINPTKTGSVKGYHPDDYSYPKDESQMFEICVGAILTQNTSWQNVEKAMLNLKKEGLLDPQKIEEADTTILAEVIRPAGYFNQKAKKLKLFSEFFIKQKNSIPSKDKLLNIWGIGPETADSICLYAYKIPVFVVDAYTRRIFEKLKIITKDATYDQIRSIVESEIKDYKKLQEFHALLVEHAKRSCTKKPACENCILRQICKFNKKY